MHLTLTALWKWTIIIIVKKYKYFLYEDDYFILIYKTEINLLHPSIFKQILEILCDEKSAVQVITGTSPHPSFLR